MINPKHQLWQWGPMDGCVQLIYFPAMATARESWRVCGYGWPEGVMFFEYPSMVWLNDHAALICHGKRFIDDILMRRKKKEQYLAQYRAAHARLARACQAGERKALSYDDAFDAYARLSIAYQVWWAWGIMIELVNVTFEYQLGQMIAKKSEYASMDASALSLLTIPARPSFYREEERELHHLACQWSALSREKQAHALSRHAKKYVWLLNTYQRARILDETYFEKRIHELLRMGRKTLLSGARDMRTEHTRLLGKKRALIRAIGFSKKDEQFLWLISEFSYLQDERKKFQFIATHTLEGVLAAIGQYADLPLESINFLTPAEVLQLRYTSSHHTIHQLIQKRRAPFAIHFTRRPPVILEAARARALKKALCKREPAKEGGIISGLVASMSVRRIRGRVRILTSSAFLHRLVDGEILVTPMTAPDYVVAMRRAAAIITDHGGMTCHAAIVARELAKPCIVGTKNATRVLKDGDFVEIDTQRGIVKKII